MTTLKISAVDTEESLMVRVNLADASSHVEMNRYDDRGWIETPWQAAHCQRRTDALAEIGTNLLAQALECNVADLGKIVVTEID